MKNILVPVAASRNIENTLQYAIDFAKFTGGKVFVLGDYNVVSRAGSILKVEEIIQRETKAYVNAFIEKIDQKGVELANVVAKGTLPEVIEKIADELAIDLVMVSSNSHIKDEVYLDAISGSIIKQMEIPTLIVPDTYKFKAPKTILTAFRSGVVKRKGVLEPLQKLQQHFGADVNLLFVKTPKHNDEDMQLNDELKSLSETLTVSENATTFQGVLEHFQSSKPEMLCVFRRKRGFFTKLWEKNIILKQEFHCPIPVLVLRGKL
ncbi:universal stress protein [Ascidiimonas sp. W6]|uniref:universal stress protein n=1 Tax=Ascidiimonas meishanensis TaxID=3128903 RepID=UPI0030EF7B76